MSHGEDVLDNWEEIDEAGLSMTLQTKLQASDPPVHKMKLLQRPQSLQESPQILSSGGGGGGGSGNPLPRQITIARKPQPPPAEVDPSAQQQLPVMMVLHKSSNEYDAASYATPTSNQTVKILRRPAQAEERRDMNGMRPKQPIKTLKQREQEYAEARLRILGAAKNPEDDKPAAPSSPAVNSSSAGAAAPSSAPPATPPAASSNNNVVNNNGSHPAAGMHRSSSAPKMSQVSPMYNNYNSYFQGPHNQPGLNYYYPHNPQQQQQQQPSPSIQPHYNQRLPPYGGGGSGMGGVGMQAQAPPQSSPNPQQSWSPVVGGSVSAALLRQQSLQSPQQQQQNQQQLGQPHPHPFNDLVLRLPKGPCPNGSIGFQMRR
ncbi:nuclear transcription factor Y subunit beta [Drosophila suzukii]|uniref:SUZ RNA-binding domain-containing n=1 Tax=Drosophila suzukii TaxID=28584 RepID=A0AB39ZZH4_DROSZ